MTHNRKEVRPTPPQYSLKFPAGEQDKDTDNQQDTQLLNVDFKEVTSTNSNGQLFTETSSGDLNPQFQELKSENFSENVGEFVSNTKHDFSIDKFNKDQMEEGLDIEFKKLTDKLRVSPLEEIPPPPIALMETGGNNAPIGTLGNFSLLTGKAKSKKSFLISIAVAAAAGDKVVINKIMGCLPDNQKNVLLFDTEQGRFHVQLAVKRTCQMIGIPDPKTLEVFGLRTLSYLERTDFIRKTIESREDVGLVVIDGIRDLVADINDPAEAVLVSGFLMKWSEKKNLHIMVVLHQNKSNDNVRGHLGTELINKAETVLKVTKDNHEKDVSVVDAVDCRAIEPLPFAFRLVDGIPVLDKVRNLNPSTRKRKTTNLLELESVFVKEALEDVFLKETEMTKSDLKRRLRPYLEKRLGEDVGYNRVVDFVLHCIDKKWIIESEVKTYYQKYILGSFILERPP